MARSLPCTRVDSGIDHLSHIHNRKRITNDHNSTQGGEIASNLAGHVAHLEPQQAH